MLGDITWFAISSSKVVQTQRVVFRDTPFVIIQTNKKNVYLGFGYPKWFFLSFKEFFKIFSLRNQIP